MTAPSGGSVRQVKVQITADVQDAIRNIGSLNNTLGQTSQQGSAATQTTSSFSEKLKQGLATAGVATGFAAISSGLKGVVADGMDYERSQNQFQAVTQATADEMARAGQTAKDLGNDVKLPGASAQTATAAMLELAKGGLSAQEAMDAARGTMTLAAAAQIDGATAAEIQANALNSFGLEADQAGRVANVLANVANKSSGEITDFADGLAQSSAVANMMGMSVEDTTTALGLFANAGIKGSDAGTTLKTSITQLLNPSKESQKAIDELGLSVFDSQGNFVGYRSIVDQLSQAQGRMSQEAFTAAAAQVLGTDAVRAGAVVAAGGTQAWDDMAAALANSNGAMDMASANSKGLSGVIDAFKNSVDTASLSLFDALSPALQELTPALTSIVDPLAQGLAPLLQVVADTATGTLAPALEQLAGFIGAVADPLSDVIGWLNDLPGPVGGAVLAIGGLVAFRGPISGLWSSLTTGMNGIRGSVTTFAGSMRAASGAMATAGVAARGFLSVIGGPIGAAIVGVGTALAFMGSSQDDVSTQTSGLSAALDEQTGKFKENADAILAKALADGGSYDSYQRIGGSVQEYTDALKQNEGAIDSVHTRLLDQATAAVEASDGYGRMIAKGAILPGTARDIASGLLEAGDAGQYGGKGLEAVLDASAKFAADSGQITDAQRQYSQAIEVSGTAAGTASEEVTKMGSAAAEAAKDTTPFGDALKEVRSAASEADAATQFLSISLLEASGNSVPAEQRARANAAAFREVGQATRDIGDANDSVAEKQARFDELAAHLGTTLDGQEVSASNAAVTQRDLDAAARDLADAQDSTKNASDKQKDALDKAAQSARDMTADAYNNGLQQLGMKGAIDQAVSTMQVQRDEFIKSATDAGIAEEAAKQLADQQGLIPDKVRTTYETVGADDAKAKAKALNDELDKVNNREVRYTVVAGEVTSVGTGRTVTGGPAAAYAEGGPVVGPGTGTSDSIHALVSNGEWISTADDVSRGGNLSALQFMHAGGTFPAFATGGMVGASVSGDYKAKDFVGGLTTYLQDINSQIQAAMAAVSTATGFNSSQDPSSFGWRRASGIVPFSWQGNPVLGGVAGGTQGLWTSLLSALVPQIPGGLTEPMYGYENRDNVNSPGTPSFHSYGLAVDVNAGANPNGVSPNSVQGRRGAIPIGPARSIASRLGMEWGGDWGFPDPMHFEIHTSPSQIASGAGPSVSTSIQNAAQQALSAFSLGLGTPAPVSGGRWDPNVERWRSTVVEALRLTGQSTALADVVLNQIRTESSGNPRAINLTDSNARKGTPSKGLIQAIDSTFQAYRLASLPNDIYNPLANIVAGIRYAVDRYGSLPAGMRGVAYATGGMVPGFAPGQDTVQAMLSPGEAVISRMPGFEGKNKALVAEAAGWFGGAVQYPDDRGYPSSAQYMQQMTRPTPIDVRVTFSGDGAITKAIIDTANVQIDVGYRQLARQIYTSMAQG